MAADSLPGWIAAYRWWLPLCAIALSACTSQPNAPIPPPADAPLPARMSPAAQTYVVDSEASTLHILVYRGGPMAQLGHNHVISSRSVSGTVWRAEALESSGFDITVPVNNLIVDDTVARAAEGQDFVAAVSEDAKAGTKVNMLRASVLDGAQFPVIRIQSIRIQGDPSAPTVVAALRIRDTTRTMTLPVRLGSKDGRLRIQGAFDIRQTDFGITPVSVALGALQVQDAITIKFELVARAP